MIIRAGIIGATGYAGAELARIIAAHPNAKLSAVTSNSFEGQRLDEIYPAFEGLTDIACSNLNIDELCKKADFFFTALPHKLPMEIVPELLKNNKKVVDLSADFRFCNPEKYEAAYQPHKSKELLKQSVYGLSEIYFDKIRNASIVGNPGCYPTSILLPLVPLLQKGIISADKIIADSKSGVSGAGRSASVTSLFCEATESFKAYKIASHRHNPEIDEILSLKSGKDVHVTFVPHLIPMSRGMLSTIYCDFKKDVKSDDIADCLSSFYKDKYFVRICSKRIPDTRHVRGTNFCDIGFKLDKDSGLLIVMSAIDNLVKGAAGQAVQNMNIMMGIEETTGLMSYGFAV